MSQYLLTLDSERCISCKACEVHCAMKNKVPEGSSLCVLVSLGPVQQGKNPKILTMFMPCFHCERPWCVTACPTGAMIKREKDGIVYVQQDLCVGCKACMMACPWTVPQWNERTGKVIKCDYCMDRVDQGLKPACVTGCTSHALRFSKPNEVSTLARREYGIRNLKRNMF